MVWPSANVTIAFLKSLRRPGRPRNTLILPSWRRVLTAITLTLNRPSMAALISGLVADSGTRKATWRWADIWVAFSVITGERTMAYISAWVSLTTRVFMGRALLISAVPPDAAPRNEQGSSHEDPRGQADPG